MTKIKYSYKTRITFSENVSRHHFQLRCTPAVSYYQQIVEETCTILPESVICIDKDNFGNTIRDGYIDSYHNFFEFESTGIVALGYYALCEPLNRLFLYPSHYTQPMEYLKELSQQIHFPAEATVLEKVVLISSALQQRLQYVPGTTTVTTTAEQALAQGTGVCQDFAHIMIALCRMKGIPARYANGFMQGEGATHAWIEYYDGDSWFGFDPTHDRKVETGYVIVAQGRDYADCAIDKGVFSGLAQQKLEVFLKVELVEQ